MTAGVPQGSVLGPCFFLVFINYLPQALKPEVKLFADDTSLFSVVNYVNYSASTINNDLTVIQDWVYHWKTFFNPDKNKQTQKVLFFRKTYSSLTNSNLNLPHSRNTLDCI